jgi:hypothetical protein
MMKRIASKFLLTFLLLASPALADGEIGCVDEFRGDASAYKIIRADKELAMQLLLPMHNGDRIEMTNEDGSVTIRLAGQLPPLVWSKADSVNALSVEIPRASFWSNLMDETVAFISPLDRQKRQQVLANIRNDGNEAFAVPLLESPQTIAAGNRTIALGWQKPSQVVEISILSKSGKKIISKAKGSGGLWISPALALKPGNYRVEILAGGKKLSGKITAADPAALPEIPAELRFETIPEPLRRTAQALWLARQDKGQYRLEALALLAGVRRSLSEKLVLEALIDGKKFELPK